MINSIRRSICFFRIVNALPVRNIGGDNIARTHLLNWLRYMEHKLTLWISEVYYILFIGFLQLLNADCLPPSFKHQEADRKLHLKLHQLIRTDSINLSLQLTRCVVHIIDTVGGNLHLSI